MARPLHACTVIVLCFCNGALAIVHSTVTYCTGDSGALKAELFLPESARSVPVLLCMHEGGFRRYDRHCFDEHGRYFSRRGIALMSIDYRRVQEGGRYPAAIRDCVEALKWLRMHADSLGIDAGRITALGASAGGYLAVMLGVLEGLSDTLRRGRSPEGKREAAVNAVISVLGLYDWEKTRWSGEGFIRPEQRREASPVNYPVSAAVSYLLFAGERDRLFGTVQARRFADKCRAAGSPVTLHVIARQGHDGICDFNGRLMQWCLPRIHEFLAGISGGL